MDRTVEIELKAHVKDTAGCKEKLTALAGEGRAFSKDDAYWFAPNMPRNFSGLRVRQETAGEDRSIRITWKNKEKRDKFEVNDEREFGITDGAVFEELLILLGLEKRICKHKQGWSWNCRGITAELCEVTGALNEPGKQSKNAGWFLELEILAEEDSSETVAAARERLLTLLEKAGIGKDRIESRYYSELLAEE